MLTGYDSHAGFLVYAITPLLHNGIIIIILYLRSRTKAVAHFYVIIDVPSTARAASFATIATELYCIAVPLAGDGVGAPENRYRGGLGLVKRRTDFFLDAAPQSIQLSRLLSTGRRRRIPLSTFLGFRNDQIGFLH